MDIVKSIRKSNPSGQKNVDIVKEISFIVFISFTISVHIIFIVFQFYILEFKYHFSDSLYMLTLNSEFVKYLKLNFFKICSITGLIIDSTYIFFS